MTDWTKLRDCPQCQAKRGQPCFDLYARPREENRVVGIQYEKPHPDRDSA